MRITSVILGRVLLLVFLICCAGVGAVAVSHTTSLAPSLDCTKNQGLTIEGFSLKAELVRQTVVKGEEVVLRITLENLSDKERKKMWCSAASNDYQLSIVAPDGKRTNINRDEEFYSTARVIFKPNQKIVSDYNINPFYDFSEVGNYEIVAARPVPKLDGEGGAVVVSNPVVLIVTASDASTHAQNTIDERLNCIEKQIKAGDEPAKIEAEYLKLLSEFKDPSDVGKIYAGLAIFYSGLSPLPSDTVITYASKALEFPLDASLKSQMHIYWGMALDNTYELHRPVEEYVKHRPEIVNQYLLGLKILLDNGVPEEFVPTPSVNRYNCVPADDPECQKYAKIHEEEVAARKKADDLNDLVRWRIWLTRSIVAIYSQGTDNRVELQRLSNQILKDDAVTDNLLVKVKEKRDKQ